MSGILLGKTMGRTDELADRFTSESSLLADLEVRQRMAGRWMMASIQTSFAVMPAAVVLVRRAALAHGSNAITVPTLIAFTTLQTRLFFPVGSLLGVGLDVQTSLALFDRIFEYLDEPIDIVERRRAGPRSTTAGDVVVRGRLVPLRRRAPGRSATSRSPSRPARRRRSSARPAPARRRSRYLTARLYDVERGGVAIGGVDVRDLAFASLARLVGVVSQETYLFHSTVRENLRFAKPDATDEEIEEAAEAARIIDLIASLPDGLRHRRRRARLPLLGRREAADRDRADDPPQPADPRARRGDERARHRDRAAGAGGARPPGRGRTTIAIAHGSRPSSTPTRSSSSTAAASSSAAATTSCSRSAAGSRSSPAARRPRPAPAGTL